MAFIVIATLFLHPHPEDFGNYVTVGNLVLAHANIYAPVADTWPPFFSLVCVPLALAADAAPRAALIGWSLLNYIALAITLALATRMIYGRPLVFGVNGGAQGGARGNGNSDRLAVSVASAAILFPLFLTLPYLIDHLEFHQINLILLALAFGGLFLAHRGRPVAGGLALGAAAAIKVMPIIFVPYLAYRRRWGAALSSAAATAIFSLSPALVFGAARFARYAATWWRLAASRTTWDAAGPNQSIYAMWDRILGHHLIPFAAPGEPGPLPLSGDPRVRIAWLATGAVVGVATLIAFGRATPAPAPGTSSPSWRNSSWSLLLEWSALFLIAAIFSPITWKHYLVVMILPNLLLYAVWRSPETAAALGAPARRVAATALLVCAALAFPTGYAFGRQLALRLETGSIVTLAVLLMLAALLWLRRRLTPQSL